VKKVLIFLIVLTMLLIIFVVYRSRSSTDQLNVDPNATREIEKAKRR
jgi:hypothetical protein